MQPRRGPLLAHGSRSLSKAVQPDDRRVKAALLNLTGVVGLLFLALSLLHVTYGMSSKQAFYAYVALFLVMDAIFVAVRLYAFFRKRSPATPDEETGIMAASKGGSYSHPLNWNTSYKSPLQYWISQSTEDAGSKKIAGGKRNSL